MEGMEGMRLNGWDWDMSGISRSPCCAVIVA
jgi:hypothetical protein